MPAAQFPRKPDAWDQNALPTKFRRPDTPRVRQAAARLGITVSEFIRASTLREVDRMGIPHTREPTVEAKGQIFAATAPQKATEAQLKTRGNIDTFRKQSLGDVLGQTDSVSRATLGMGMKDIPPRS